MLLSDLLKNIKVIKVFQTKYGKSVISHDIQINKIEYDSRKIINGDLFVAIRGHDFDGHKFIPDALAKGARAVILENDQLYPDSYFMHNNAAKIVVGNSRAVLAELSANFFNKPANKLQIVGITGTNGKTTTSYIIKAILEEHIKSQNLNMRVGLIGTIENQIGDEVIPSNLTTPESLELHKLLADFVKKEAKWVVMEVSSHSLVLNRVHGINFKFAVFTNLTPEHLDFHKNMDEYFKAKKILFDNLTNGAFAISNLGVEYGDAIVKDTKAKKIFYAVEQRADVFADDIKIGFEGTSFNLHYQGETTQIRMPLLGKMNVSNALAGISVALSLGIELNIIKNALQGMKNVRGRFETLCSPVGWIAVIDYAHTPDALENCLLNVKEILKTQNKDGRIITVFGAGGDRDKTKRPKMGKIAEFLSDIVVVTSDNPRTENPMQIIEDIKKGIVNPGKLVVEIDRKNAIEYALTIAKSGDIIVIAGKGHEDYQIIGKEKLHFSDREIVQNFIHKVK